MNNISQELARFAVATKWENLPEASIQETKHILMDTIGCALGIAGHLCMVLSYGRWQYSKNKRFVKCLTTLN